MKQTEPITSRKDIQRFKNYYLKKENYRDYLLITVCLNTALRIGDVISLKAEDVYSFKKSAPKDYIVLREQKTNKSAKIFINEAIKNAILLYKKNCGLEEGYLFAGYKNTHITRITAYRIIKEGAINTGIDISCHSLRKTFGYHAWKKGIPPVLLMKIYNHSSFDITKRYLGIEQEDKDKVFKKVVL